MMLPVFFHKFIRNVLGQNSPKSGGNYFSKSRSCALHLRLPMSIKDNNCVWTPSIFGYNVWLGFNYLSIVSKYFTFPHLGKKNTTTKKPRNYCRAPNKNCPRRRLTVRASYSIYNNPGLILESSQPSKLIGKESLFFRWLFPVCSWWTDNVLAISNFG